MTCINQIANCCYIVYVLYTSPTATTFRNDSHSKYCLSQPSLVGRSFILVWLGELIIFHKISFYSRAFYWLYETKLTGTILRVYGGNMYFVTGLHPYFLSPFLKNSHVIGRLQVAACFANNISSYQACIARFWNKRSNELPPFIFLRYGKYFLLYGFIGWWSPDKVVPHTFANFYPHTKNIVISYTVSNFFWIIPFILFSKTVPKVTGHQNQQVGWNNPCSISIHRLIYKSYIFHEGEGEIFFRSYGSV